MQFARLSVSFLKRRIHNFGHQPPVATTIKLSFRRSRCMLMTYVVRFPFRCYFGGDLGRKRRASKTLAPFLFACNLAEN